MLSAWNSQRTKQAKKVERHASTQVSAEVVGMDAPSALKSRARSAESLAAVVLGAGSGWLKALPGHHMVRCFGLHLDGVRLSVIGKSLIGYGLLHCTFSNRHYVKSLFLAIGPSEANRPTPHGGAERSHPSPLLRSRSRTP